MNQRAFNLFTALVSFVMILLAVLMVNSMTRTEERAITTVSDLQQQSEMQTIADLARGDTFQTVVFSIRSAMEDYFVNTDAEVSSSAVNYISLRESLTWDESIRNFACAQLGICGSSGINGQLAHYMAQNTETNLSDTDVYGRYKVYLELASGPQQSQLEKALVEALNEAQLANEADPDAEPPVFELVNCTYDDDTDTADCLNGTFYINLRFDLISNETFESLPKIVVTDFNVTDAVIKAGILPRSKLRVFVPVRIFQALSRAKEIADKTVFEPTVKANLEATEIGLCNPSSCNVRIATGAHSSTENTQDGQFACAGTRYGINGNDVSPKLGSKKIGGISFDPNDVRSMQTAIKEFTLGTLCAFADAAAGSQEAYQNELEINRDHPPNPDCIFSPNLNPNVLTRAIYVKSTAAGTGACVTFQGGTNTYLSVDFIEHNPAYRVTNSLDGFMQIRIFPEFGEHPDLTGKICKTSCNPPDLSVCGGATCSA